MTLGRAFVYSPCVRLISLSARNTSKELYREMLIFGAKLSVDEGKAAPDG
jgi:hypothetical protein